MAVCAAVGESRQCEANTGWKDHPRECAQPATCYFETADGHLYMCEAHAVVCADQTGGRARRLAGGEDAT